jgi:hypothetical protein
LQDNSAETQPHDNPKKSKAQPSTDKDQGTSNRIPKEENARRAKVIPFPGKRDGRKGSNRGNK